MEPQEELKQLLDRQESLQQELKARKKELLQAQRRQRDNLKRQILRAQSRVSSAERKRRTRRLILMGSYLEHLIGDDPAQRDRRQERSRWLSWSGPRTGPCSTCLPVPIRAPKLLSPAGGVPSPSLRFSGLDVQPGSLNRMFSLWGWFCSWKVYPQTRRAYYLFPYYLFFNYMSG